VKCVGKTPNSRFLHRKGPLSRAFSLSGRRDSNSGPLVPQADAAWSAWGRMAQPCGFESLRFPLMARDSRLAVGMV
jgi:hypothetical protein